MRNILLLCLAITLTGSAIFRLTAEHKTAQQERAIRHLKHKELQLRAEIDRLAFEVDVLESAPRLNQLSADRLPLSPGSARQMAGSAELRDVIQPAARLENRP